MKVISTASELQCFLCDNETLLWPPKATTVGVHFQFAGDGEEGDKSVAVAISTSELFEEAVLLLLASLSETLIIPGLTTLLSKASVYKVMYSVHKIAFWLSRFGLQNPKLENCIDLQLLYEITENMTVLNANIPQIANNCFQNSAKNLELTTHSYIARAESADAKNWTKTPLPSKMQLLVAQTAQLYAQCYAENRAKSSDKVNVQ
ncbi:hypothetical protein PsorP6_017897 [Peronosclerospora sorghi]|uniref:Uncharacterized protein n=1 Tax=Peronosclerospora sorghi TaxID=230839 RepID=A0ACC0WBQ8_9STRA|nr:hypothetical protein PsorP6_017897 [Peronosclerospora sorghi]